MSRGRVKSSVLDSSRRAIILCAPQDLQPFEPVHGWRMRIPVVVHFLDVVFEVGTGWSAAALEAVALHECPEPERERKGFATSMAEVGQLAVSPSVSLELVRVGVAGRDDVVKTLERVRSRFLRLRR